MLRFLLFYLAPIIMLLAVVVLSFMSFGVLRLAQGTPPGIGLFLGVVAFVLMFYGVLGAIALFFYSAYFREVIGTLKLGGLEFEFTARTIDWVKFVLGTVAIVVFTLGIGYIFVAYRNWAFFIRHLKAYGEIDLDRVTQSTTREPGQGEGLLDAFDIGAF